MNENIILANKISLMDTLLFVIAMFFYRFSLFLRKYFKKIKMKFFFNEAQDSPSKRKHFGCNLVALHSQ